MRIFTLLSILLLGAVMPVYLNAGMEKSEDPEQDQLFNPVKWSTYSEQVAEDEFILTLQAEIDDGWKIYSAFMADNGGPLPTLFEFNPGDHYELLGEMEETGEITSGHDDIFDMEVTSIKHKAIYKQRVKVKDVLKSISGYLSFMTCDDERCLPPTDVDFDFSLANEAISTQEKVEVTDDTELLDQKIGSLFSTYTNPISDCGEQEDEKSGLLWTFILGFIGGLLALLTPCVFPMIPLTVSYFTKGSVERKSGIKNGTIYGLSIIGIYVGIGLLITAFFGESALNSLSTNWLANTLFFVIFIVFAFSFFGFYEITLPSSWSTKTDKWADRGGLIGIFFMAFTLAIVSFSCTGPIIGTAIVQSATEKLGPFTVMLGFSTALALPFGLFAAFPAWLNSLPRSGTWMNSVKVVLGFLELALAFKFLSIADMTSHWNVLKYEPFMIIWILVAFATALYLFGFIKFPHDSKVVKLSAGRIGFATLFAIIGFYLLTGFKHNDKTATYNSLSLMSGLAPPAHYNFFKKMPGVDPVIKAKYPSYSKCANNLDCFKDYTEGVAYAKEVGKPIFVDFTGYGCVNCRKTEEHIWIEDQVWNKLKDDFVLLSLYVDDREALPEQIISARKKAGSDEHKLLRTVGDKWADFQIVNFRQNTQPLYIMLNHEEEVMAAPRGYETGVQSYVEFLECGLATFNTK